MGNRYSDKDEFHLTNFRHFANKGDKLLEIIINSWCVQFIPIPLERTDVNSYLKSNETISRFDIRFKLKKIRGKGNFQWTNAGKKGDMVEAWIWFLYINYGYDAVERYIYKQILKIYNDEYK